MFKSPAWASFIDVNIAKGIVDAVSPARLLAYGLQPQLANSIEPVAQHGRNITLCEAFYPVLHMFEVVMRNSIHDTFSRYFGAATWYDQGWLQPGHINLVAEAKKELTRKSKPITSDRVVAELTLGFWCGMFHHGYETATGPWPVLITSVLPRVPKSWRTRPKIKARVERARDIRNMVFHHERIAHLTNLRDRHRELVELLGWFSPEARQHVERICRFNAVLSDRLIPI